MNNVIETTNLPFETVVENKENKTIKRDEMLSNLFDLFQAGVISFQQYRQGIMSCQL